MFENCYQLKNIDLSKFTISNTAIVTDMLRGCSNLDLSSLIILDQNILNNMFKNLCPNYLSDYKAGIDSLS